jgi:hypothetical protein
MLKTTSLLHFRASRKSQFPQSHSAQTAPHLPVINDDCIPPHLLSILGALPLDILGSPNRPATGPSKSGCVVLEDSRLLASLDTSIDKSTAERRLSSLPCHSLPRPTSNTIRSTPVAFAHLRVLCPWSKQPKQSLIIHTTPLTTRTAPAP